MDCPECGSKLYEENGILNLVDKNYHKSSCKTVDIENEERKLQKMRVVIELMIKIKPVRNYNINHIPKVIFEREENQITLMYNISQKAKILTNPKKLNIERKLLDKLNELKQLDGVESDSSTLTSKRTELEKIRKIYHMCKKRDNNEVSINHLISTLPECDETMCPPDSCRLSSLNKIRIAREPEIPYTIMETCNSLTELLKQHKNILCPENLRNFTLIQLKNMENELNNEWKIVNDLEIESKFMDENIHRTTENVENINKEIEPGVEEKFDRLEKSFKENEKTIKDAEKLTNFLNDYGKITNLKEKLSVLAKDKKTVENLLGLARDIECELLRRTSSIVNTYLDDILSHLFVNDPITVSIDMFKKNTNGITVAEPNISISYKKSTPHKSLTKMSGGEQDRISIALTLAYAKCMNNPLILMLDECFSSLNSDLRSKCIDVIRQFCGAKIILIISHEDELGIYDNVIELEDT